MNVLATQRGSAHFPSMLEDVEAGRPTEVELINERFVRGPSAQGSTRRAKPRSRLDPGREASYFVKVCVVGCGAVGGLFAANLAQLDDVEVWAYDLDADHVAAINERGLRLSGAGEVVGQVRATTDPGELPECDFRPRGDEVDAHRGRSRGRLPPHSSTPPRPPSRTASATKRRSPSAWERSSAARRSLQVASSSPATCSGM